MEAIQDDINARIRSTIVSALARKISPDEITGEDLVSELGMTSVDALEVLIRIEGEFGIVIDDSDLSQQLVSSLEHLSDYVREKLSTQ